LKITGTPPQPVRDDLELVAIASEEPAAFSHLYERYKGKIYNYIRYRVNDAPTAEDLTAEVFEGAFRGLAHFTPTKGTFAGWLFGIARNKTARHLKISGLRSWISLERLTGLASDHQPHDDTIAERQEQEELLAAIGQLSGKQRDVIGLKFGGGLTNQRIAQILGVSPTSVGVRLYRGLRRLRAALEARGWRFE